MKTATPRGSWILALPLLAAGLLATAATGVPADVAPPGPGAADGAGDGATTAGDIHVVELKGMVHSLATSYVLDSLEDAEQRGASLFVLEMDTPGGLLETTKEFCQRILGSKVPVVVFVAPSGARAASAGFYILLAADVAVMAPGTNTGAAHPIGPGQTDPDDIGLKKAASDTAAFARSLAENRGRNVEEAEKAVIEAVSFTEKEALEKGLIDFIASSREDLLEKIEGRTIRRFDGSEVVVATSGEISEPLEKDWMQRYVTPILNTPEIVLLLIGLGLMGIYLELSNPGLILPGVVGVVCLLFVALAFQYLPVNVVGLLLIALACVLFILEIKVTSYGMLSLGGTASLVAGLLLVFPRDIPGLKVSLWFVMPLALTVSGVMAVVVTLVSRSQTARLATGLEGMIGEIGTVSSELSPDGKVYVHGELWDARSSEPVARGEEVRVTAVEGMRLRVEKPRR